MIKRLSFISISKIQQNYFQTMLDLQLYSGSIFILAVFYASIDPVVSVKYVGHALIPSRLSEPFIDAAEVSLPTCSALCSIAESCFAVSFHRETMRCELLNKTGYFGEYLLTDNDGWRVYSNVMGKFFHTTKKSNKCYIQRFHLSSCFMLHPG